VHPRKRIVEYCTKRKETNCFFSAAHFFFKYKTRTQWVIRLRRSKQESRLLTRKEAIVVPEETD
jgi:hypothetical protein